jgi:hypothetical protein
VQVRDDAGAVVFERAQAIPVNQFTSARSANILLDVPAARLAAGEYLLSLQAVSGKEVVRRDSRFRVLR